MPLSKSESSSAVIAATICAGLVTAQFVGGKAARDALFLAQLDVTSLPAMVIATSIFSIALVVVNAKGVTRLSPARFVPWAFLVSAGLLLVEWALTATWPTLAAILVYLHISGAGPILGSGFWLITSERFDPRTAKKSFGQIAGGGTVGGLLGGLLAERVAVMFGISAMLPVLAILNLLCAWQVTRLAPVTASPLPSREFSPELTPEPAWSGVRVLAETPYLRHLALLVLLGTTSAALIDYVFKAKAVEAFGTGEGLLRFFALYYAGTSLVTFALQTSMSRVALEKLGLAFTSATPSIALFGGTLGALVAPGLEGAIVARGAESVFRGSLFRSGYELFYTPIPTAEKRAAKSIIDVGFDRIGDAVGGGAIRSILLLSPSLQYSAVLSLTLVCSAAAVIVASRLNRGYVQTLERNLRNRALQLDLTDVNDLTTRTIMLNTLSVALPEHASLGAVVSAAPERPASKTQSNLDPDVQDIVRLRSRDRDRVLAVIRRKEDLPPALIPHVIPLLAWDPVADDVIVSLRKVAPNHVGALSDALLNPYEDFAVRRRIPRVLAVCRTQRAVESLILGLSDIRFEVRFQCGRSLAAIVAKQPDLRIDADRVFEVVQKEVAVGRPVWEGRNLLDRLDEGESTFVDDFIKSRASQSLAHVFTVLSLVLPAEPLQIALRGLYVEDQNLRGTALEYLESVLPPAIREPLWPFLEDRRPGTRTVRARDEILADLVRSNHSIMLNLEELKQRTDSSERRERAVEPRRSR
jgi:ATP:ADP antiporter, AAA family